MKVVDLFCGAGGFSLGLQRAGLKVIKALDYNTAALAVHAANLEEPSLGRLPRLPIVPPLRSGQKWPPKRGYLRDYARVVQGVDLMDLISHGPEMAMMRPDIIVGGPPCQPYSQAGEQLGDWDWRSALTEAFAMMISCGRPAYFVMENVPEVTNSHAYQRVVAMFRVLGYGLTELKVDASFYGTPQGRKRWICAGALNDSDGWLRPYLEQYASLRRVTLADELGPDFGVTLDDIIIPGAVRTATVEPRNPDGSRVKEGSHARLKDRDVQVVLKSEPGERFFYAHAGGAQSASLRVTTDPCPTVTGKSQARLPKTYRPRTTDWIDLRPLPQPTFEEYSRLCGFPDDWKWNVPGYQVAFTNLSVHRFPAPGQSDLNQMLGNAVAPPLAECIGRAIIDHASALVPGARASKCLREGSGEPIADNEKPFEVSAQYRKWLLRERGVRETAISQEISNLRRAKREVAAYGFKSTQRELRALERVLRVALAHLDGGMKSSLRRALRDFAAWEEYKALRKSRTPKRQARPRGKVTEAPEDTLKEDLLNTEGPEDNLSEEWEYERDLADDAEQRRALPSLGLLRGFEIGAAPSSTKRTT